MIWNIGNRKHEVKGLDDLLVINRSSLNSNEQEAWDLLSRWLEGQPLIFTTSGSTGDSTEVEISRELVVWSVGQTSKAIGPQIFKAFVSIPVQKIGGAMLVLRAFLNNWGIQVVEPSSDPMEHLADDHSFDLISLVPYQFFTLIKNGPSSQKLKKFNSILLGGEPISSLKEQQAIEWIGTTSIKVFHSYGMTECASHIALRELGAPNYRAFEDVSLGIDNANHLTIDIPHLSVHIQTADLVDLQNKKEFRFVGRSSFVVNSAGVKIVLEELEHKIEEILGVDVKTEFFLWKEEDETLGERLVFLSVSNSEELEILLNKRLERYRVPKRFYLVEKIIRTSSGKIDRKSTYERFNQNRRST